MSNDAKGIAGLGIILMTAAGGYIVFGFAGSLLAVGALFVIAGMAD